MALHLTVEAGHLNKPDILNSKTLYLRRQQSALFSHPTLARFGRFRYTQYRSCVPTQGEEILTQASEERGSDEDEGDSEDSAEGPAEEVLQGLPGCASTRRGRAGVQLRY